MTTSANLHKKLKKIFESLDSEIKDRISAENSPMRQGFAVLEIARVEGDIEYLADDDISFALDAVGTNVEPSRISKAFGRTSKSKVKKVEIDGEAYFKLMRPGRLDIEGILEVGNLKVFYIEPKTPWTATKMLRDVLASLQGEIKISDPYYGLNTLYSLELIPSSCQVKFLTASASGKDKSALAKAVSDFQKENPNIEMRKYSPKKDLHDRYILHNDGILLLGHGIKDIGNSESFIVVLPIDVIRDMHKSISLQFDSRWSNSTPI